MKKTLVVLLLFLITFPIFAQYTVTSVTGAVQKEIRPNVWQPITVGETLQSDTVIRTGIGAVLVIKRGDETHTINSGSLGMIMDVLHNSRQIRISGNVATTDLTVTARRSGHISTASARASDAAADIEFCEE